MAPIEIMARAIDQASETRFYGDEAKDLAQAALTALADAGPSEAMIAAGVEVANMPIGSIVPPGEDADRYMLRLIFTAMIEAAKEGL